MFLSLILMLKENENKKLNITLSTFSQSIFYDFLVFSAISYKLLSHQTIFSLEKFKKKSTTNILVAIERFTTILLPLHKRQFKTLKRFPYFFYSSTNRNITSFRMSFKTSRNRLWHFGKQMFYNKQTCNIHCTRAFISAITYLSSLALLSSFIYNLFVATVKQHSM